MPFYYVCPHKVLTSACLSVGRLPHRPHQVAHESNRRRTPSSLWQQRRIPVASGDYNAIGIQEWTLFRPQLVKGGALPSRRPWQYGLAIATGVAKVTAR